MNLQIFAGLLLFKARKQRRLVFHFANGGAEADNNKKNNNIKKVKSALNKFYL